MKKGNESKKQKIVLKSHYESLSMEDKLALRDAVIRRSGMSLPTFYYKMKQNSWKPLEQELFIDILNNISNERKLE